MQAEHQQAETVDYKKKYQTMKKKLRMLVYEQECFVDELKKSQRKLLKVSRDKSFLLDRLLQYEKVAEMSSDSESTESSDSGNEAVKEAGSAKKKKIPGSVNSTPAGQPSGSNSQMSMMLGGGMLGSYLMGQTPRTSEPVKKKPKIVKKVTPKTASRIPNVTKTLADTKFPTNSTSEGHLSREEVERHLEMKHSIKPHFMSLDMASHNLPDDIFSHDSSNQECSIQHEDDQELIIDMAH